MPAVFEEDRKFWYGTPTFQDPIILNGQNPVLFYPISLRNMLHYGSKLGLKSGIDILWNKMLFYIDLDNDRKRWMQNFQIFSAYVRITNMEI